MVLNGTSPQEVGHMLRSASRLTRSNAVRRRVVLRPGAMPLYLDLVRAADELAGAVDALRFGEPVTHVYNPLRYAALAHREYLRRYANAKKRIVFLGMNPGPFGMAQTGVPFGEVTLVRDWLGIDKPVGRPEREHPKRKVEGFACTRSEVSGARLWGALAERYGQPDRFFAERFIANYCPLVFMEASGKNRTPDKLPPGERDALYAACDAHLRALVRALEPEWVIGVGKFGEARAQAALEGSSVRVGSILHPSPASPLANRGWADQADVQLKQLGLRL
jgi:single-strand selective monofunctional uracil DNA glycosylase